jgi:hypothetical protein
LRKSGCGCHIVDIFVAAILYADDLALLAPIRSSLQKLIDICIEYGKIWCVEYNFQKTKVMTFGKSCDTMSVCDITLDGRVVSCIHEWKYLGVTIRQVVHLLAQLVQTLGIFIAQVNVNSSCRPSNDVLMKLFYSSCIPILTYCAEVKVLSSRDMMQINTAVNNGIRKIFTFNRWESVRTLHTDMGYKGICNIFAERQKKCCP